MKYSLKDISVKTPGVQIRDKIIESYGSIRAFADHIKLYESSINQYLSSKTLGSSTFKIRTTNAFGIDFHKLYLSDEDQIRQYASNISLYIKEYNQNQDIEVLDKMKRIILDYELMEDYAIICRCYAYFYYNQSKVDRAIAYIDVAVDTMRDRSYIDRFGLYLSDAIYMKMDRMSKKEFKLLREEYEKIAKEVTGPLTKGYMYTNLGKAYFRFGDYDNCKDCYNEVFNYHKSELELQLLHLNYARLYEEVGDKVNAYNSYLKAEELMSEDSSQKIDIWNGYAQYALGNRNMKEAEKYIDLIFNDEAWIISASDHTYLKSFVEVKFALGKEDEIIEVFMRLISEVRLGYIFIFQHLTAMETLIEERSFGLAFLKEMIKIVKVTYNKYKLEDDLNSALKRLLGTLTLKA